MSRRVQVELVGRGRVLAARTDRTLLESAESAGVRLPYGCRVGSCLNCAARLIAGHVSMPPGTALPEVHLRARIFLPCVAQPRTDCVVEVGRHLGVLDVPPWTD